MWASGRRRLGVGEAALAAVPAYGFAFKTLNVNRSDVYVVITCSKVYIFGREFSAKV